MRSSPTLPKTWFDWVLGERVQKTDCGILLGDAKITDLDFADDVVIFTETLEVLLHAFDTMNMDSAPIGLRVSQIKTIRF